MFLDIDKSWTLFLDRDGVINVKKENDYIKKWEDFSFVEGSLAAIALLSKLFGKIIIVTNQRGVGRGLMKEVDLVSIHEKMIKEINYMSGKIDKIYYSVDIFDHAFTRKPNPGMGLQAKHDFPDIDFKKSVMVGDSLTDMSFGEKLGMRNVLISDCDNNYDGKLFYFKSLFSFSRKCVELNPNY